MAAVARRFDATAAGELWRVTLERGGGWDEQTVGVARVHAREEESIWILKWGLLPLHTGVMKLGEIRSTFTTPSRSLSFLSIQEPVTSPGRLYWLLGRFLLCRRHDGCS